MRIAGTKSPIQRQGDHCSCPGIFAHTSEYCDVIAIMRSGVVILKVYHLSLQRSKVNIVDNAFTISVHLVD